MSVSRFDQYRQEFFSRIEQIYQERGADYNRGFTIREYFIYGVRSIFQEIWVVAMRLKSLVHEYTDCVPYPDSDKLNDKLMDLVNYASFMYAENEIRREERKREMNAKALQSLINLPGYEEALYGESVIKPTISEIIERDAESSGNTVERVVLEPRPAAVDYGGVIFPPGSDHAFNPCHEACPSCREYAERSRADNRGDHADVGNIPDTPVDAGAASKDSSCSVLRRRSSDIGQKQI